MCEIQPCILVTRWEAAYTVAQPHYGFCRVLLTAPLPSCHNLLPSLLPTPSTPRLQCSPPSCGIFGVGRLSSLSKGQLCLKHSWSIAIYRDSHKDLAHCLCTCIVPFFLMVTLDGVHSFPFFWTWRGTSFVHRQSCHPRSWCCTYVQHQGRVGHGKMVKCPGLCVLIVCRHSRVQMVGLDFMSHTVCRCLQSLWMDTYPNHIT